MSESTSCAMDNTNDNHDHDDNDGSTTTTTTTTNTFRWKLLLYMTLTCCRIIIGPMLPGYVHPDEFFQGGQELWFGCPSYVPWEFRGGPQSAIRSVAPPTLMTWWPLRLYQLVCAYCRPQLDRMDSSHVLSVPDALSGSEILYLPRLWMGLWSVLTVDGAVYWLSCRCNNGHKTNKDMGLDALLILSTSWTVWVFLSRPFTNTAETMLLSILLVLVLPFVSKKQQNKVTMMSPKGTTPSTKMDKSQEETTILTNQSSGPLSGIWIGATVAMGIMTRFTFVFFAIPSGILFLVQIWTGRRRPLSILTAFVGLGVMALTCAGYDRIHLQEMNGTDHDKDRHALSDLPIIPLHAFRYNSKVSNLMDHGLHPRWIHAVVNLPMLFGPLAFLFYCALYRKANKWIWDDWRRTKQKDTNSRIGPRNEDRETSTIELVLLGTALTGLAFLSLAPHQEPRFLLPLVLPLVITGTPRLVRSKWLLAVWIVFNCVLLLLFGVLHQGSVVPSLLQRFDTTTTTISPSSSSTTTIDNWSFMATMTNVVYFRTYMPPTFVSRHVSFSTCQDESINPDGICVATSCLPATTFVDLKGSSLDVLQDTLHELLECPTKAGVADSNNTERSVVDVIAPWIQEDDPQVLVLTPDDCWIGDSFHCTPVRSFGPHLTTEDFPSLDGSITDVLQRFQLSVHRVRCNQS